MRVLGYGSLGAFIGLAAGALGGALFGAAAEAIGASIWSPTLDSNFSMSDVDTSAKMGAAGNGILLGAVGLFAGAGAGLFRSGFMTKKSSEFGGCALGLGITALCALPMAGGALGQAVLKSHVPDPITVEASILYCMTGAAVIDAAATVIFMLALCVRKNYDFHPENNNHASSSNVPSKV